MINLIVEISGGVVVGMYSDAHQGQEFEVLLLDRDCGEEFIEDFEENKRLDALLRESGWRRID